MSWFSIIKWAQISHVAFLLTWDLLFENLIFMLLLVYPTLEYWCNMHSIKYIISSKWSAFHQEILVCMKSAHNAVYAKTETFSLCTPVIHSKSFSAPFCPKEIMIGIDDDNYAKAYIPIANTYYPFPCTSNHYNYHQVGTLWFLWVVLVLFSDNRRVAKILCHTQ